MLLWRSYVNNIEKTAGKKLHIVWKSEHKMSPHPTGCGLNLLFNKGKWEIVDHMSGFQNTAINGEINGFHLERTEVSVDHTAGDHQLTGGAHGADQICKGLVEIDIQLHSLESEGIDCNRLRKYASFLQFLQDRFSGDLGRLNSFDVKAICIVVG